MADELYCSTSRGLNWGEYVKAVHINNADPVKNSKYFDDMYDSGHMRNALSRMCDSRSLPPTKTHFAKLLNFDNPMNPAFGGGYYAGFTD